MPLQFNTDCNVLRDDPRWNVLVERAQNDQGCDKRIQDLEAQHWRVTCLKVASVAAFCLMVGVAFIMPTLGFFQQPSWVMYGIGLPSTLLLFIISAVAKTLLDQKIEEKECLHDHYSYLRQMTQESSFKIPYPHIEWDEHLKSEKKVRDGGVFGLKVPFPKSTADTERLVGIRSAPKRLCVDLEVTTNLKPNVCRGLASMDQGVDWKKVKKLVGGAKENLAEALALGKDPTLGHLAEKKMKEASSKINQAKYLALRVGGDDPPHIERMRQFPEQEELEKQYTSFCNLFFELEGLHNAGVALYGESHPEWSEYFNEVKDLRELMQPFTRKEKNLVDIRNMRTLFSFYYFDNAYKKRGELEAWIQRHPDHHEEMYRKQLAALEGRILRLDPSPSEAEIQRWVEQEHRPSDPKRDRNAREILRKASIENILERNRRMRIEFDSAKAAFDAQFPARSTKGKAKVNSEDLEEKKKAVAARKEALEAFGTKHLGPLRLTINNRIGRSSRRGVLVFLKDYFSGRLAKPFEKVTSIKHYRKIEQIQMQRILKKMDQNFSRLNFGFRMSHAALLTTLLLVEAFFSTFLWMHFGFVGGFVALTLLSMYVDHRLKMMHRKMEEVKLRHYFQDRPLMTHTPGNRPTLKELKRVQAEYGLDGTAPTRAKCIIHGERAVSKSFAELAKKGRNEVNAALNDFSKGKKVPRTKTAYETLVGKRNKVVNERIKIEKKIDGLCIQQRFDKVKIVGNPLFNELDLKRAEIAQMTIEIEKMRSRLLKRS